MTAIKRKEKMLIPRGDVVLEQDDTVVLGAEPFDEKEQILLKEVILQKEHPWTGARIRDIDMSRYSLIVLVKRKNKVLIPYGNMFLNEGDRVFLYTQMHLESVSEIEI
jgi:voltage-gated potassium channel